MSNFREIRHVAEAADAAGFAAPETRNLVDGSLFSEADIGLLGKLKESLANPENRAQLLDILESRTQEPVPLAEIINVLEKFSHRQNELREGLTPADIKFLSFTVHYFEDWFYRGEWVDVPKKENGQEYNYLAVPAGIVNMLTKIKELPSYTEAVGGFDKDKLRALWNEVRGFANNFLQDNHLDPAARRSILATFRQSANSVHSELAFGSSAADLYFLKTCIIAAEMARRQDENSGQHIFIPDQALPTKKNEYHMFDFNPQGDESGLTRMHYPTHRLPYCKFVVEYLRSH